ncbi:MAG: hypothetical protein IPP49_12515 [Saprospiraceae bacterium]|nr:hypothetical protein [Saprospiraceae bacterium]
MCSIRFQKCRPRFGTIDDLRSLDDKLKSKGMYLMLDIVLNHTSHHHEWAQKASSGDKHYQDFFYMYDDRHMPDIMERTMPDIFPDSSPGSFTYDKASGKWVMTVFNDYQWDLNYTNPVVFAEMLDNIFLCQSRSGHTSNRCTGIHMERSRYHMSESASGSYPPSADQTLCTSSYSWYGIAR